MKVDVALCVLTEQVLGGRASQQRADDTRTAEGDTQTRFDVATERDANRLQRTGIPALQVLTGGACHLDARQVERVLGFEAFRNLDVLFIENVGNLVCPTAFDLGEDFKVALLSVTEGDDKPFKYPGLFARAPVTLITKIDLLPHVAFDLG